MSGGIILRRSYPRRIFVRVLLWSILAAGMVAVQSSPKAAAAAPATTEADKLSRDGSLRPRSAPVDLDGLAAYIERARKQWAVTGLAVTVVKDDQVVMARGFGVREIGKAAPVDEHTIFALSSMGKAFSAAAAAVLVDEGRLDWDDPIIKHLPWFQMSDPWVTRQVSIRDLLAHRSGIGDEIWGSTGAARDVIARRARYMRQLSSFRSSYDYSNVGITIAGLAIAKAAGLDWHSLMRERVLRPLNMKSSTTDLSMLWNPSDVAPCYLCELDHRVGIEQALHPNVVMPHVWQEGEVRPIAWRTVENIAPAGSINSNAVDMAQWLRMQLGRGIYDGRRFLSEAAVNEMHKPQNIIQPEQLPVGAILAEAEDRFHFWAYGLGWRMNDYRGMKMIWHTGGITGFSSIMALLPGAKLGISVLTNNWRSSPDLLVHAIVLRIFDAYLGASPEDWSTELLARSEAVRFQREKKDLELGASRILGTSPSLPLAAYAGTYVHPAHDEISLKVEDGHLVLRFPGALAGSLEHWHYDTFRVRLHSPFRDFTFGTFVLDSRRRVASLQVEMFGEFAKSN